MIGNRVNSASPSTFDSPLTRVFWTSLYGMPVAVIPASRNSFAVWSGTLTSLNAITSGFRAAISALISGCRSLQRLWPCSRLSVATRNCIGLSRRLRPTGYAALRSHSPEEVSTRVGAALLLLVFYLAPVPVSFCLPDTRSGRGTVTSVKLVEIRDCGSRRPDAVAPVEGCLQSVRLRAAIDGTADCAAGAVPLSSPAPDGAPLRGCGA